MRKKNIIRPACSCLARGRRVYHLGKIYDAM